MPHLYELFVALGSTSFAFHFLAPTPNVRPLALIIAVVLFIIAAILSVIPVI